MYVILMDKRFISLMCTEFLEVVKKRVDMFFKVDSMNRHFIERKYKWTFKNLKYIQNHA